MNDSVNTAHGDEMPEISIVIPCHNEAANIGKLCSAISGVLDAKRERFEIVCVDDGSRDETFEKIRGIAAQETRVRLVRLARNFGKEAALTAGMDHSLGDAVIFMDGDMQHPPEAIPEMLAKWRDGADMVIALRSNRNSDSWLRRAFTSTFYRLFSALSDVEVSPQTGDFRLFDRRAVICLQALPERTRFLKGLYSLIGLRVETTVYVEESRGSGKSKFGFRHLWRFAIDGLTSFTSFPLRVWTYVGVTLALPAGLYAAYIFIRTLVFGVDVPGYASIATMILFFSGIQLLGLGIFGEYLARVYQETKQRPLYIVSETIGNFDSATQLPHGGIRLPDRKKVARSDSEK